MKMLLFLAAPLTQALLVKESAVVSFPHDSFHSQSGQDKWLLEHVFTPAGITADHGEHYFIEFGARNGLFLSNSFFFEDQLKWSGVLIEPGMDDMATLPHNRKCTVGAIQNACLHAAVTDKEGQQLTFHGEHKIAHDRVVSAAVKQQLGDGAHQNVTALEQTPVMSTTLNAIVRDFRLPRIDLLSADCEGCELAAIKAFNFQIPVSVLLVERNSDSCEIKRLLQSKGFLHVRLLSSSDDVFVHQDVANKIKPNLKPAGNGCVEDYTSATWPSSA